MKLYPAIDLKGGYCVRLEQGDFNRETRYDEPANAAKRWVNMGAEYLHLVDLDGALEGKFVNEDAIKSIANAVDVPLQLGGGIRSIDDIEKRLEAGVSRVILGTIAVKNPDFVTEAIGRFGAECIVVGIDGKDAMVATHGWLETSETSIYDFAKDMVNRGVKTLICTDISRDGMLSEPNFDQLGQLVKETGINIIASGGMSKVSQLPKLKGLGCSGTIIGKALYTGHIDLEEALELCK